MRGLNQLTPFLQIPPCDDTYDPSTRHNVPCNELRAKIIALRIYFAVIVINFVFIITTTCYFVYRMLSAKWASPPTDLASATNQTISKRWQIYSLKKRGLFGSVLGAIGHLIFSTAVFSYQAFVDIFSCDVYVFASMLGFYIWIYALVWRTHRLHLSIRMSELQGRYHERNTATSAMNNNNNNNNNRNTLTHQATSSSVSKKEDQDYVWFMRHKDRLSKSTAYHAFIFCASIFVIFIIITLSETLGIWEGGFSRCEFYMGDYVVLGMVVFFFVVIVPIIIWYVRDDDDAHGIRNELWVTMAVGAPCFIMNIVWLVLFAYPSDTYPASARGEFSPSNWIVIMTTANHIMTIVLPNFKTISVDGHKKKRRRSGVSPSSRRGSYTRGGDNNRAPDMVYLKGHHRNVSTNTIESSLTSSDFRWELSTESLYQALCDPETLKILKNWAVKDFSVENILFYDHYIYLVQHLDRATVAARHQSTSSEGSNLLDVPSISGHHSDNKKLNQDLIQASNRESIISQATTLSKPTDEMLNIPFTADLIPDIVAFYTTFIADQAPLQVNISHRSRKDIDAILKPLVQDEDSAAALPSNSIDIPEESHPNPRGATYKLLSTSINSYRPHSEITMESGGSSSATYNNKNAKSINMPTKEDNTATANLTLEIFEEARQEVFWNIFTGIFAKVVEAYSNGSDN